MTRSKADWRRWAKQERTPEVLRSVSTTIVEALRSWSTLSASPMSLAYVALSDEVDISALVDADPARWCLPRLVGETMMLHAATGSLERHGLGFRQPSADAPEISPAAIAVALIPGLAFDRTGVRLGRGGGHYDRLLPALPMTTARVGVAVDAVVVDELPAEFHDVRMTHIVTESGIVAVE